MTQGGSDADQAHPRPCRCREFEIGLGHGRHGDERKFQTDMAVGQSRHRPQVALLEDLPGRQQGAVTLGKMGVEPTTIDQGHAVLPPSCLAPESHVGRQFKLCRPAAAAEAAQAPVNPDTDQGPPLTWKIEAVTAPSRSPSGGRSPRRPSPGGACGQRHRSKPHESQPAGWPRRRGRRCGRPLTR